MTEPNRSAPTGLSRTLRFTALNAVLPGTAFLAAGRRRLGAGILAVFLVLVGVVAYLAAERRRELVELALDPTGLGWGIAVVSALAAAWLGVVAAGYAVLRPPGMLPWQRAVGSLLVVLLGVAGIVPTALVVRSASAQQELLATVFPDQRRSATVEEPEDPANPFGTDRRVNVLLLGGDGGEGRRGVRTDTVIVASIETATGATTLFSLPRNLQDVPFPPGTPLAERWPDGFDSGNGSAGLLNAIYRAGPRLAPDALGPTDDPGADMLKLAVGEVLGLHIDYYVLVNLDGFVQFVDALGGITVDVNYYVPIGGEPSLGIYPDAYIPPGPDQHLDGERALDFVRGRFGMSDYERMDRQRCALEAIVEAADPVTVLLEYQELAGATEKLVRTDIPRSVLGDFLDLALLVDEVDLRSVVFDDEVITPASPDYGRIRALVQEALRPAPAPASEAAPPVVPGDDGPPAAPDADAAPEPGPVTDTEDACAYDPDRAAQARAAGEPPTRAG